jgi:NADPH-dependent 2,4-dienoyl-CoA reductase/sulfur reductase-like enzyme
VTAFLPHDGSTNVAALELADGRRLDAELVVVGVGVRPATGWLLDAPLHLDGGAVGVDSEGRTNLPGVYAAGDVTATWDQSVMAHVRHEHWANAIDQGQRVARAITGAPRLRPRCRRSGPTSTTAACSTPAVTTPTASWLSAVTSVSPTPRWWRSSRAPARSPRS